MFFVIKCFGMIFKMICFIMFVLIFLSVLDVLCCVDNIIVVILSGLWFLLYKIDIWDLLFGLSFDIIFFFLIKVKCLVNLCVRKIGKGKSFLVLFLV